MRAQVRSIHTPDSPRELFQIGVELENPSNVWGVPSPPPDWHRLTNGDLSTTHLATGGALPREPQSNPPVNGALNSSTGSSTHGPQAVPSPAVGDAKQQSAPPKTERFVITSDQLILSVRPKLQQAAEQAIQNAISSQLDEAVRSALRTIDDLQRANSRQTAEVSTQNFEPMIRTSEESILNRLEARLGEVRSQWQEQQDAQRRQVEEMSARLEKLIADARREIGETRNAPEKTGQIESVMLDTKVQGRMEELVKRATQEFESAATRVSDRHLVRLMEDKQMVAREASAQLEARAAEARAMLHSSASDAVEEFRRQLQAQVDMLISEASQKATSSMASIEAENHAACETRRRSLESDVARAAEQSAEQFRTGIKAFLYSCLVAAVSAVDEHSQSTLEGLMKEGPKDSKENGHNGKLPHFTIDNSNDNKEN